MENKMNPEELYNDLNTLRMLVFIEDEPFSNRYRQVMFDFEEYKKVAESFGEKTGEKTGNNIDIVKSDFSEEIYTLPDLQQYYLNKMEK